MSAAADTTEPAPTFIGTNRLFAYGSKALARVPFTYGDRAYQPGDEFPYRKIGLGFAALRDLHNASLIDTPCPP